MNLNLGIGRSLITSICRALKNTIVGTGSDTVASTDATVVVQTQISPLEIKLNRLLAETTPPSPFIQYASAYAPRNQLTELWFDTEHGSFRVSVTPSGDGTHVAIQYMRMR